MTKRNNELSETEVVIISGDLLTLLSRPGQLPISQFGPARYNFYVPNMLPEEEISRLERISKSVSIDEKEIGPKTISEALYGIVKQETTLNLIPKQFTAYLLRTREAINVIMDEVTKEGKLPVALPLPNWHFWDLDTKGGGKYNFVYLNGETEANLVESFERAVKKKKLSTLILVDPANPLQYRFSEQGVKEIDRVALKYGVEIIVDDILRGTLEVENRDTIARWLTNPHVVEGLGKRFGEDPFSSFSYVIRGYDREDASPDIRIECTSKEDFIMAAEIAAARRYATSPALTELQNRNAALDEALSPAVAEGLKVTRSHPTGLTTLLEFPKKWDIVGELFAQTAFVNGVVVRSMNCFYPSNHKIPKNFENMIRLAVGNMEVSDIRRGANKVMQGIKYFRGQQ